MHRVTHQAALAAGLIGGISWVANLFVDHDVLSRAGSLLVVLAAGLVGAGMSRLLWLASITALSSATLTWSVVDLLRDIGEVRVVEGVLGAGAALLVAVALLLTMRGASAVRAAKPGGHRGGHRDRGNHRG